MTNERGETLWFVWKNEGRVVEETDYWGGRRRYDYDPVGVLLENIDPLGRSTPYTFYPIGRIAARTLDDGRQKSSTVKKGNMVNHTANNGAFNACERIPQDQKRIQWSFCSTKETVAKKNNPRLLWHIVLAIYVIFL